MNIPNTKTPLLDQVDLRMGTFSKSIASCGGFLAGSHEVIDFLRIQSRSFLFTASAVPAAIGAALAAVKICNSDDGPPLFAEVLENAAYLRAGLKGLGFNVVERKDAPAAILATREASALCRPTTTLMMKAL